MFHRYSCDRLWFCLQRSRMYHLLQTGKRKMLIIYRTKSDVARGSEVGACITTQLRNYCSEYCARIWLCTLRCIPWTGLVYIVAAIIKPMTARVTVAVTCRCTKTEKITATLSISSCQAWAWNWNMCTIPPELSRHARKFRMVYLWTPNPKPGGNHPDAI